MEANGTFIPSSLPGESHLPGHRLWPVVSLFEPSENLSLAKAEIRPHPHIGDLSAFHVRINRLHVNPDEPLQLPGGEDLRETVGVQKHQRAMAHGRRKWRWNVRL